MKTTFTYFFLTLICVSTLSLFSCKKEKNPDKDPDKDERTAFVGLYDYSLTGFMNFSINGQEMTLPISGKNHQLNIYKEGVSGSRVAMKNGLAPNVVYGYVSGSHITWDAFTIEEAPEKGMRVVITYNSQSDLNGNNLNTQYSGYGTLYYNNSSYPINSSVTMTANKTL